MEDVAEKLREILVKLTGTARNQNLTYTKDKTEVNKYFDEKIDIAIQNIKSLIPKKKTLEILSDHPTPLECLNEGRREGFNQAVDEMERGGEK